MGGDTNEEATRPSVAAAVFGEDAADLARATGLSEELDREIRQCIGNGDPMVLAALAGSAIENGG